MEKNNKIIKLKKRRRFNLGVLIFLIIFVYLIIYTIMFINKPHLSIYEVKRESLSVETVAEGIIIREEMIATSEKAGKVNYYQRDGARIKKNSMIYSIDENNIFNSFSNVDTYSITEEDARQIKKRIASFDKKYTDSNYGTINDYKGDIIGSIQQMIDQYMMDQLIISGNNSSVNAVYSNKSGIISYKVDIFDNIQVNDVNLSLFDKENFTSSDLRSLSLIETGGKVYKLITSDSWKIAAPIDEKLYELLLSRTSVSIRILEDNLELIATVDVEKSEGEYYAILSLNSYMLRYKDYRFIEVEFLVESNVGLKIPVTSITEKEFYLVPIYFFTKGGNDNKENGLIIRTINESLGDYEYTFFPCEVYYYDGKYAYIDKNEFTLNTYVVKPDNVEGELDIFRFSLVGSLKGVYNINKGFAVFKRIEIIDENDEYCIVKEGTSNGIAVYDHIAVDEDTAVEEKSIY